MSLFIKKVQESALVGGLLLLSACGTSTAEKGTEIITEKPKTSEISNTVDTHATYLKTMFQDSFQIGTALSRVQILNKEPGTLALVEKHFDVITPENSMKWERIHPEPSTYDFLASDELVNFSKKNKIGIVGHTLVWHAQTPDWVFQNKAGTDATRDELLSRMKEHINTVAGRYGEDIGAWDVVNEALNEDGSMRDSKWRQIIGDDFIAKAFEFSALAAPNSKLYYNDYNLFKPEKREGVIKLVKQLQAKGIRIDGIGIQGHYALDYPDLQQLEDSIVAFAALGVDVMLTELDVSVLPFPDEENQGADISLDIELQDKYNPYPNGLPNDVNEQLAQRYHEIFTLLAKHKEKIGRVTFWGVHDGQTWRNGWPMSGRSDYPLFFDRNLTLKSFVADLPK